MTLREKIREAVESEIKEQLADVVEDEAKAVLNDIITSEARDQLRNLNIEDYCDVESIVEAEIGDMLDE